MEKDDYFVVAYRILAYLYACMKEGGRPDMSKVSFQALNIPERYWADVLESLSDEGYIKGVSIQGGMGDTVYVKMDKPKITLAGIQFLQENSAMARAKNALKEFKEIVPGL